MNINVLEIRNYLIKPNVLEHFIDYFEEQFIDSQEAENIRVLGQFRPIGEPNRFVWLRGFADMQSRLKSLQAFYSGAGWEKYGALANEMMLEWHNVHLLRPLTNIDDFLCGLNAEAIAADLAAGTILYETGVLAIDFYQALPGKRDKLVDKFQTRIAPIYENQGIQVRGLFVAEMTENQFVQLPVIQNEDELVVITAHRSEEVFCKKRARIAPFIDKTIGACLSPMPTPLLLDPTLRSPLRYLKSELPLATP